MKRDDRFILRNSNFAFWSAFWLTVLWFCLPIPFMIFSGPQSPVLNVITVLFGIPGAILAVIIKSYRIKVDGSTFTVNRGFRKTYTFDVSDIDRIIWKIHMTQWGRMDIIRIETDFYRRHFRVETYMEGFEKMINYLVNHVPESKIEYRKKTFHNAI